MKTFIVGSPFAAIGLALALSVLGSSPLPITSNEMQQQRPTLTPMPRPTLTPQGFELMSTALGYSSLSSIRGTMFEDSNRNGHRYRDEPVLSNGSFKITGGGQWFVCGNVDGDGTFGVVVQPGVYYIIPINIASYMATNKRMTATVTSTASLNNDIGYTKDLSVRGESCDQYNPRH